MDWSQHSIPADAARGALRRPRGAGVSASGRTASGRWSSEAAARNPDGEALVCGERRMSWREVAQQSAASRRQACARSACSAATASRCCSATASNSCWRCSARRISALVTVLLGTRQQKPEIAYVLADCGAKLLIHEAALADRLPDARDVPDLMHRIAVDDDAGALAVFRPASSTRPCRRPPMSAKKTPR